VRALERKLLRDLWHLKGQVLTVALVVACGISAFVGMRGTYTSLVRSCTAYYDRYRFGDVFAHLRRAPDAVQPRLETLPGVARAYTRVLDYVRIPFEGDPQPPTASLVTIPSGGVAPLNDLRLERGRLPDPGRANEALLLERFAVGHHIGPGDTLPVVIKGVRSVLRIVGLANAPEFIYPMQPGTVTFDEERAAVIWMTRDAVAPALDMEGAFNDVVVRLEPGASSAAVTAELDGILEPYGGLGAVDRSRQLSNYVLRGELEQLQSFATAMPLIFLGISAFLLNVVFGRLVQLQRGQVATLKAVGYADLQIGLHYLGFVTGVVVIGTLLGIGLGAWFGLALTRLYGNIFHLPILSYRVEPSIVAVSFAASLGAAAVGAGGSVWRLTRLPPAEAMQPPAPAAYRPLLLERLGLGDVVSPAARMVLRHVERRPARAASTIVGVALALALLAHSGREEPDRRDLAKLCSRVENDWVGAETGLLDQLASLCGRTGHAIRIDFRTLAIDPVPLELGEWRLVTLDSGAAHSIAESGYNERRRECREACQRLGIESLSEANAPDLDSLPEPLAARGRHVVTENARGALITGALRAGDVAARCGLFDASHASMRDDFDVSVPEVDLLVELAAADPAIFGARMTGGGFGGCKVSLVRRDQVDAFGRIVRDRYTAATGRAPDIHVMDAGDRGARVL